MSFLVLGPYSGGCTSTSTSCTTNVLWTVVYVKKVFGGNLDFPKIKILKKVCSDVFTCTKMWKQLNFKQNFTLILFIASKWPILAVLAYKK